MPPSDQEPRYRLVDSNGNVVGALWGDGNGNVKIADETDTQTTFGPDGISTPALEADELSYNITDNTEVTSSRSLNTEFQNTDSTNRVVTVGMSIDGSSSVESLNARLLVGNSPGLDGGDFRDQFQVYNYDDEYFYTFTAVVPVGAYYKLETFLDGRLVNWKEANYS
jgi:hypothetical protein